MEFIDPQSFENLIQHRRTIGPKLFNKETPDHDAVIEAIGIARHAPNHHRTEPCRFYLLDAPRIKRVGELFGEQVRGTNPTAESIARGEKKTKEWGTAPGLLVVTQYTPRDSKLVQNKPEVIKEDYATCCCILQNLCLLLHNKGIGSKWSTGPVWEHPEFAEVVGLQDSVPDEEVVGLIFYGNHNEEPSVRDLSALGSSLINYRAGNYS